LRILDRAKRRFLEDENDQSIGEAINFRMRDFVWETDALVDSDRVFPPTVCETMVIKARQLDWDCIERIFREVGEAAEATFAELTRGMMICEDENRFPNSMASIPNRFTVVVRGPSFVNTSNRYATLAEAESALYCLRRAADSATWPGHRSTQTRVIVVVPKRIHEAREFSIR
jgi:hypothetical protein